METRLTFRPGDKGTRKLVERFGERRLRVRYLYDSENARRLKTVELIVQCVLWRPRARAVRRRDDDIVPVRIAWHEADLRARETPRRGMAAGAKTVGGVRRADARILGIADRVVES